MSGAERWCRAMRPATFALAALAVPALIAGCGMPGAPQPPSLNLPEKVTDLAAVRNGDQVTLTWTMPRRTTDRLLLKDAVQARICRTESGTEACAVAGSDQFAPGADATFHEMLPAQLASGSARPLTYYVELVNRRGRSAGLSNAAGVAAGLAPGAVVGLTAEMRRKGVILTWQPDASEAAPTEIRLVRTLLTPPGPREKRESGSSQRGAPKDHGGGLLAPPPEPLERTLLVDASASSGGRAIDEEIRFNERYEYRVQRVVVVKSGDHTLQLAGPLSEPVDVDTRNTFPPAVPTGLAAVGTSGTNGAGNEAHPAIDLNWLPNTEPDLAGYIVYRREGDGEWQRISPAQPVVGPAFHDANVTAGHTYQYSVSSIDQEGHESAKSKAAEETAPSP